MQVLDPASESVPEEVVAQGPERDRAVDFLRVLAIGLVVLGHWLVTSPTYHDGAFQAPSVLGTIRWGQWVTLAFQVMPVFFLVGGYAAAISWAGHARRGGRTRGRRGSRPPDRSQIAGICERCPASPTAAPCRPADAR